MWQMDGVVERHGLGEREKKAELRTRPFEARV